MSEDLINKVVDTEAVKKQMDALFEQLQKVVQTIQQINQAGGQITLNAGLSASAKAATDAKAKVEELKVARQELINQEQQLKNAALQAAQAAQAQAAANKTAQQQSAAAAKAAAAATASASAAAIQASKQQTAAIQAQAAANRLVQQQNAQAAKAAAAAAAAAALSQAGSINQLRAQLNQARKDYDALGAAARNSGPGAKALSDIQNMDAQLKKLEATTGRFRLNVGNYPQVVGGITSLLGAFGVGTGLYGIKQIIDLKGKISDELGDVQRIMKITAADTDELFESLKKLDTRTSTSGLLNIAIVAAKAGIAKENIVGITQAIDKLSVVLGSELGDADKITSDLIKIINVFGKDGKVTGEALTFLGNGIVQLAHAGVSTAPFIVDFTRRVGAIAKVANVSLASALGLGAGFEEMGAKAEVSGTAVVQILTKMGADLPKFAKIAGVALKDFTKTFRDNPVEALIEATQGAQRGHEFFDQFAANFKDLEAKGVRVAGTLALLGSKADFFRGKIDLVSGALKDNSAINDSFEIKNNTLAGSFDKLMKAIQNLVNDPNSNLGGFFAGIIKGLTGAITLLDVFTSRLGGLKQRNLTPEGLLQIKTSTSGGFGTDDESDRLLKFNKAYDKAISQIKTTNDTYIEDFKNSTAKQQLILLEGLRTTLEESKKLVKSYDDVTGLTGGALNFTKPLGRDKDTADYIAAKLAADKAEDAYKRAAAIVKGGAVKPDDDGDPYKKDLTEKELNKAAHLRELRTQALTDDQKFQIQSEIDTQKRIIDNDQASTAERLAATDLYYQKKKELSELDAKNDKAKIQEEISRGRAVPEQLLAINNRANKEEVDNKLELSANLKKILTNDKDDRVKLTTQNYSEQSKAIEKAANKELKLNEDYFEKNKISKEAYELEIIRIDNKYGILQLQNELELQKKLLEIISTTADPDKIKEVKNKILDIENKIEDLNLKYFVDTQKKMTEYEKAEQAKRAKLKHDELALIKQLGKETLNFIFAVIDAQFTKQKNAIQDQADALDKNTQKEIEAVNSSTDSAQQKADKITVINARAQAQKEELDRRQRKIDQEKARFDRLKAIGDVISNTAVAVSKYVGELPASAPLIALAVATGAAQLGTILATPIPRYRYGTKDHKGGPAIVNDGGRLEVMESPTGKAYVAPGLDAMVNLPEHYRVHTSIEDYQAAKGHSSYQSFVTPDGKLIELKAITDRIDKNSEKQTQELLAGMERNKSIVNIKYTWSGVEVSQQTITRTIDYLSKNVRL